MRLLMAAGINQAVLTFPSWVAHTQYITNNDPSTPNNAAALTNIIGLCAYYGIRCIDYWGEIKRAVAAGEHTLSEYVTTVDPVHPTTFGHSVAAGMIQPFLASLIYGARQYTGSLPARLYDNGDYENTPVTKTGADYDSKTGTWTTTGTVVSSTEAGATITFSATCQSFGSAYDLVTQNNQGIVVDYQVDGGNWVLSTNINRSGVNIGARAAHTIVLRIPAGGSAIIAQFLAV